MANQYYGLNQGQTDFQVLQQSSPTGEAMQFNITTGLGLQKEDAVFALKYIEMYILANNFPPASSGTYYFGLNQGQVETDVLAQSSTTSRSMELSVSMTASLLREDVIFAIGMITRYILANSWIGA